MSFSQIKGSRSQKFPQWSSDSLKRAIFLIDCQAFYITYLNLKFNLQHLVFGGEKVKVKYANFDEELMQPPQFNQWLANIYRVKSNKTMIQISIRQQLINDVQIIDHLNQI